MRELFGRSNVSTLMRRRRGLFLLVLALGVGVGPLSASADGPILHEYVNVDPTVDAEYGVTIEGGFAAELLTHSGKITAPDPGRPVDPKGPSYGPKSAVPDTGFTPDRDPRRVDRLPYDDPFRPRLAPFKRLVALDAVDADYKLFVRDPKRKAVDVGKEKLVSGGVDSFYVDLPLELKSGTAIRIPSAVAGTIVQKAHMSPAIPFRIEKDGAENLFVVADTSGSARLVLELAAPREGFGGLTTAYDWYELPKVPALPANVQKAVDTFVAEIKLDKTALRPYEAIKKLVEYFRAFKESEDPIAITSDGIYLDVARSKKGVCRHRAFAMTITALGLGIPARFVHNEAHAWVEVHDGYLYRRFDLGGAGRVLDDKSEKPEKPQPNYEPPTDPVSWPSGATKGSDLLPPAGPITPTPSPSGTPTTPPTAPPTGSSTPSSTAPPSKVALSLPGLAGEAPEVLRTKGLGVKGTVTSSGGDPCKKVRVEIILKNNAKGLERAVGVLVTDDKGEYDAKVNLPSDLDLGDYSVLAHTPGNKECGQGTSE